MKQDPGLAGAPGSRLLEVGTEMRNRAEVTFLGGESGTGVADSTVRGGRIRPQGWQRCDEDHAGHQGVGGGEEKPPGGGVPLVLPTARSSTPGKARGQVKVC